MTIENVAKKVDGLTEVVGELAKTVDKLAGMTKRGFDAVTDDVNGMKEEVVKLRERNALDHEDLKLRLDNTAHRFELDDLKERVTNLEEKAKFH